MENDFEDAQWQTQVDCPIHFKPEQEDSMSGINPTFIPSNSTSDPSDSTSDSKCVEIKSDNTLLRWYNDFKRSSNHGWAMDMRGSYDRGEFFLLAHSLDEISLQERVIHYVKHEPEFTVAKCATWLRNLISTRFPLDHAARKITICTTTMYHWLDIIGAKFETQTKSYYTDNHESEHNVKYRSIYIKRHAYLSMRQPVWISVPLNEVSSHAYEDAQFRSKFQILQK
jgi:hypothetical protein